MEVLRDPSHARALPLGELRALFVAAGLGEPSVTPWSYDVDVEAMLGRSFPAPGAEPTIRRMFEDSVADDALGLGTRWEEGKLRFTTRTVILAAVAHTLPMGESRAERRKRAKAEERQRQEELDRREAEPAPPPFEAPPKGIIVEDPPRKKG
jgi:hypothetical protein